MKKSLVSAALIGGLVVAGSGTGFAQQAKAASPSSVVNLAQQGIGQKYVWGVNDCSGFTQKVFGKLGVSLPRTAAEQATVGVPVSQANLQPGDLVFFTTYAPGITHVGIYVGNNRMISAENAQTGVRETQIFNGGASSYWAPRYVTARRVASSQSAPQQTVNQNTTSTAASNASASNHPAASVVKSVTTATPSAAQNGTSYNVQSGDTLSAISLKTNISVANLKAINGLTSDKIFAGQVLKLKGQAVKTSKPQTQTKAAATSTKTTSSVTKPATKATVTQSTATTKTVAAQPAAKATQGTYFVRTGDSLWAISRDNGISVSQIKTANHLSSSTIYPGQKLNVAKTANVSKKYTIKKGDTLWDIAVAHGTTVFRLVEANHITSTTIFPDHQLVIPQK
jgi:Cell wall-associated hydrolases (invasion-associated proteins)